MYTTGLTINITLNQFFFKNINNKKVNVGKFGKRRPKIKSFLL